MKLSLSWLKEYIDPKLSTDELVERLTMAGLEVEGVEKHGGDVIIDLEVTPNRPDWLSVQGLARDIGAILQKKVTFPSVKEYAKKKSSVRVHIDNKQDCPRYVATHFTGSKVVENSSWAKALNSIGTRSISNAVDITNFILMDMGQPLHVFDYDKIEGGSIIVRRAKAGETIVTLDGIERKLDPSILVIADSKKPIAIAGIMGGMETQVTASTKNILLESASFDPVLIRRASRTLSLRSDSSYRFERGVDIKGVLAAANYATQLLLESTKAKLVGRLDAYTESRAKEKPIALSAAEVNQYLGTALKPAQIKKGLLSLGFKVLGTELFKVKAPSFRRDITQTVDLIEEIARLVGFDKLPMSMPVIKAQNINIDNRLLALKKKWRQNLLAAGLDEVVTFSTTNKRDLARCQLDKMPAVAVFNPLNIDQELMRPSLLPSLLQVALTNINRGQKDLRIFELGKRYATDNEEEVLGILMTGRRYQDWRLGKKEVVEFFDIKGVVERITGAVLSFEKSDWHVFAANTGTEIYYKGKVAGVVGKINSAILNNWDIKNQDIYFAALGVATFVEENKRQKYQPIPAFPAVVRDVSLSVKKDLPYVRVETICKEKGGALLNRVQFIEQYVGDKIAADQKALVFSLVYQSSERTLREEEVNASYEAVIQSLIHELGATRR